MTQLKHTIPAMSIGLALTLSAPLGARAQVVTNQIPPIVTYNYTDQFLSNFSGLCTSSNCPAIVNTGPPNLVGSSFFDVPTNYIINAKTSMHNLDSSAQNGTCQLFAQFFGNLPPLIIDQTDIRMDHGNLAEDGNAAGDKQSIALQGALCPSDNNLVSDIGVACSTFNGVVNETMLTVIPFVPSPPFGNNEGLGNKSNISPCTPARISP